MKHYCSHIITINITDCIELCYNYLAKGLYFFSFLTHHCYLGDILVLHFPSLFIFLCFLLLLHLLYSSPASLAFLMSSSSSFLYFLLSLYFLSFSSLMPLVLKCFLLLLLLLFIGLSTVLVNYEICWQSGDPFG